MHHPGLFIIEFSINRNIKMLIFGIFACMFLKTVWFVSTLSIPFTPAALAAPSLDILSFRRRPVLCSCRSPDLRVELKSNIHVLLSCLLDCLPYQPTVLPGRPPCLTTSKRGTLFSQQPKYSSIAFRNPPSKCTSQNLIRATSESLVTSFSEPMNISTTRSGVMAMDPWALKISGPPGSGSRHHDEQFTRQASDGECAREHMH